MVDNPTESPLTLEGVALVDSVKRLVAPVLQEKQTEMGTDNKLDAEWLALYESARDVDIFKSQAHDYVAAWLQTAKGFGIALQSESPREIAFINYQYEGNGTNYFDVVNLEARTEGEAEQGINIPAPHLDRTFVRTLREKAKFNNVERPEHNRRFANAEKVVDCTAPAYLRLAELAKTVDLSKLCRTVYDFSDYQDESERWASIDHLVGSLQDVNEDNVHEFARNRIGNWF